MSYDYSLVLKSLNENPKIGYYILGVFITDGSVRFKTEHEATECALFSRDGDWIQLISDTLGGATKVIPKDNGYRIRFWNKEIFDWFVGRGCLPNKSLNAEFPKIPDQYLPDFLRGCIDGDGSITYTSYKKNGRSYPKVNTYLCGSSISFLKEFEIILRARGINCSFIEKKNKASHAIQYKHPHYRVVMNDSRACKFLEWIYYPNHKLSMPRKRELVAKILGDNLFKNKA
jgi:hypothetical protein